MRTLFARHVEDRRLVGVPYVSQVGVVTTDAFAGAHVCPLDRPLRRGDIAIVSTFVDGNQGSVTLTPNWRNLGFTAVSIEIQSNAFLAEAGPVDAGDDSYTFSTPSNLRVNFAFVVVRNARAVISNAVGVTTGTAAAPPELPTGGGSPQYQAWGAPTRLALWVSMVGRDGPGPITGFPSGLPDNRMAAQNPGGSSVAVATGLVTADARSVAGQFTSDAPDEWAIRSFQFI